LLNNFTIGKGKEQFGNFATADYERSKFDMARAVIDDPRVKESLDVAKTGIKRKLKEKDIA
jgi:hypothetical protein